MHNLCLLWSCFNNHIRLFGVKAAISDIVFWLISFGSTFLKCLQHFLVTYGDVIYFCITQNTLICNKCINCLLSVCWLTIFEINDFVLERAFLVWDDSQLHWMSLIELRIYPGPIMTHCLQTECVTPLKGPASWEAGSVFPPRSFWPLPTNK